jgi:transcriptional regulator with PAS, ATPase and Fis domain
MRLIESADHAYARALVLATPDGEKPAHALLQELRTKVADVQLVTVKLRDPSDHAELFRALSPIVQRLADEERAPDQAPRIDILLSAGTPQMQSLWLILVKAGLLHARMLQVIPAAFVPSIHPRAVREVKLDIEGFPEIRALRDEVARLRAHTQILHGQLVGDSEPMRELAKRVARVAPTDLPVLITGETGTGKELVARAVHASSQRAAGPMITENCGALSETLLSSELFGHDKGAFTGAMQAKRGLFEMAHGGTLFLDEIGELSPRVQVSLLRVLQDGTLRRLGSEKTVRVDVRIVAATHRDLAAMVQAGTFREDLYYRLQGASIAVPPLRDRIADLEVLIAHFMAEVNSNLRITREAWRVLVAYTWPGNVRELRAEVLRWHVFCDRWVRPEDLDARILAAPTAALQQSMPVDVQELATVVANAERHAIRAALTKAEQNLSRAAALLGIDRNTLKRKLRTLAIEHTRLPAGRPE